MNSPNVFTSLFLIFYSAHVNQIKMVYLETGLPKQPWKASSTAFGKFSLCLWPTAQPLWFPICLTHDSDGTFPFILVRKQNSVNQPGRYLLCAGSQKGKTEDFLPGTDTKKHIIVGNFLLTSFSLNSRSPEFLKYKHSPQSTSLLLYSPIVWLLFIWRSHDWVRRDGAGVKSPEHSGGGPEFSSQLSYWAAFNRLWLQLQGPPVLLNF